MNIHPRWLLVATLTTGLLGYMLGTDNDDPNSNRLAADSTLESNAVGEIPPGATRRQSASQGSRNQSPGASFDPGYNTAYDRSPTDTDNYNPEIGRSDFSGRSQPLRNVQNRYLFDAPDHTSRGGQRRNRASQPGANYYQFRPLEKNEQTRRWRGNYQRMSTPPAQLATPNTSGFHVTQLDPVDPRF